MTNSLAPQKDGMTIDAISLQQQLRAIKTDANNLLAGISDAQFNWRPAPHVWSMAQCFTHLNVFGREYLPQIEEKIIAAQKKHVFGAGHYNVRLLGKFFLNSLEPPVKMKFKAPKIFQPVPDSSLVSVTTEFYQLQDEIINLITQAEKLNWAKVKVTSPVTKLLRFNLTEIFAVFAAHERRHIWQAGQVRRQANFPH